MAARHQRLLVGQQHTLASGKRREHAFQAHHAYHAHQHVVCIRLSSQRKRFGAKDPFAEPQVRRNFFPGNGLNQASQPRTKSPHLLKELFAAGIRGERGHFEAVGMQRGHLQAPACRCCPWNPV